MLRLADVHRAGPVPVFSFVMLALVTRVGVEATGALFEVVSETEGPFRHGHRQRRGLAVRHTETTVSRSQRCAGSASIRGCHIAEIAISGLRTGSSKL
jgi:hypothetical protein